MISSTSNARIKNIIKIKKSARERRKQACFLVEGPRMFFEIPPEDILECYMTEEFEEKHKDRLAGRSWDRIGENVGRALSDTQTPQGVFALVRMKEMKAEELLLAGENQPPCLLLLEHIQDPGNLGTMFRSGEAAGITGIVMDSATVDPYNPKVIRSTMGSVFRLPFAIVDDIKEAGRILKEKGVALYAADLSGQVLYGHDFRQACAFFIGNEGNGLTEETARLADRRLRIPMEGQVESLNASMAATIILYELVRQRKWESCSQGPVEK